MSKIVCPFVVSGATIYFVFYLSFNYYRVALSLFYWYRRNGHLNGRNEHRSK